VGALLRSFTALKKRLQKPADGGTPLEQPLLEASVMLSLPSITVNPGLDDIQNTINSVTHSVTTRSSCFVHHPRHGNSFPDGNLLCSAMPPASLGTCSFSGHESPFAVQHNEQNRTACSLTLAVWLDLKEPSYHS
jgi:hypothetical protein